jgi:hypothetical protein
MSEGFNPTLILWLNLVGTFVFGLSGGLAAVRARMDVFGVIVLAGVVGLAGGIVRDLLIGVPPATFRDWRYLVAVGATAAVCFFAGQAVERVQRSVLFFDAMGLAVFCVTGATKRSTFTSAPFRRSSSARSPASAAACSATSCSARYPPSSVMSSTRSPRLPAPRSSQSPTSPAAGAPCSR